MADSSTIGCYFLLCAGDEVKNTNNAGCRKCRYYLQTVRECLKENRRGELMRSGLIGKCAEFKEIQRYDSDLVKGTTYAPKL